MSGENVKMENAFTHSCFLSQQGTRRRVDFPVSRFALSLSLSLLWPNDAPVTQVSTYKLPTLAPSFHPWDPFDSIPPTEKSLISGSLVHIPARHL